MKYSLRTSLMFFGLGLMFFAGCSEALETVPVYGTVTIEGRERPKVCRLFFHPVQVSGGPTRPSVAQLDERGSYTARAFKDSDGLIPGTYRVNVTYYDLRPGGDPSFETSWIQHNYNAGDLVVDRQAGEVEHNIRVPRKS